MACWDEFCQCQLMYSHASQQVITSCNRGRLAALVAHQEGEKFKGENCLYDHIALQKNMPQRAVRHTTTFRPVPPNSYPLARGHVSTTVASAPLQ